MTTDQRTQYEPTRTPATSAGAGVPIQVAFHWLDEADRQHVSPQYWQWCELFERDPTARVAQHPDHLFAELGATTIADDRLDDRASSAAVLCRAVAGTQPVALGVLVPKRLSLRQAGGFVPNISLSGYRLAGNRFLGNADEALTRQMLAACANFSAEQKTTFLLIEDLERHDPLFAAAESLTELGFRVFSPTGLQERLKIEFPANPADYWAKFSSKTRNTFKRKQKKIGTTRLERVTHPDQVAEFLATAHAISRRTWQSEKLGLRIHNNHAELRLFTVLAMHGWLRSYLLFVDGQPAAFLIGTQHLGLFSYEEVGYDRDLADRSPGQVLLLQVLDDLCRHDPPRVFDFGGGAADYKQLFATTSSTSGNVWLVAPGLRSQACLTYLRGCRWLDRTARAVIQKIGATTLLRQWIRGKYAWTSARRAADTEDTSSRGKPPCQEDDV